MDYHSISFCFTGMISNDLNYIILSVVAHLQKKFISVSVQIWNDIVLSFLSLVIIIIIIVTIIVIFRTNPNALYNFLVKSRVVRLATTTDVQAKLLIRVKFVSTYRTLSDGSYDSGSTCLRKSLLTLYMTVILLYAFYTVSCTLSNKHFRVRVRNLRHSFEVRAPADEIPVMVVKMPCSNSMMTSSTGNFFRVTGHLCGEFTGPR